ncbi:hypothetical protein EJB05_46470, partial [Eragrostis curvula]
MPRTNGVSAASSTGAGTDGARSRKFNRRPVDLPLHLTEKILCCIGPLESARLATVCKSWAAVVSDRLAARPVPHLFVCTTTPENKPGSCGLIVSVSPDGSAVSSIPARVRRADTNNQRCIASTPCGRLAYSRCGCASVVLVNPATGASQTIDLGVPLKPNTTPVLVTGGASAGNYSFFCSDIGVDRLVLRRRAGGKNGDDWTDIRTVAITAPARGSTRTIQSAVECDGCFYVRHENNRDVSVIVATAQPQPLRMEALPTAGGIPGGIEGYLLV